jgi:bacteriorhodopsin
MFDFIKNNFKTILKISFVVFILYWIVFVLTPKSQMAANPSSGQPEVGK